MTRQLTEMETGWVNRHEKDSTSLLNKEMQINYNFTAILWTKIKDLQYQVLARMWSNRNTHTLLVGVNWYNHFGE